MRAFRRILIHQMDRSTRHNRGYGVLVDELRVAVASQEHTKIIEPGHDPLQLDAVDEEYRERNLVLADVVEKRVLQDVFGVGVRVGDVLGQAVNLAVITTYENRKGAGIALLDALNQFLIVQILEGVWSIHRQP